MASYNELKVYNKGSETDGMFYNSSAFLIIVNVRETVKFLESDPSIVASIFALEKSNVVDEIVFHALAGINEPMMMTEEPYIYAFMKVLEEANLFDKISELLVYNYLADNVKLIDEITDVQALIKATEKLKASDKIDIDVLIRVLQEVGFEELLDLAVSVKTFDSFYLIDSLPRKAISDFLIGKSDDLDLAYDWILPFEMKVDWRSSSIQVMPQSESEYIDIPGVDGSVVRNTLYKNRLFTIVAYSNDGLTPLQKEELKADIARILDSTKEKSRKFTMQAADISFDAKYTGTASITEGPSFVKATIPFETSPYGYPLFDNEVFGSGLLINNGDDDSGFVNVISGGCENPSFSIGTITYKWNGTVPIGSKLYIDHNGFSCYLEDNLGNRTNSLAQLTGEFQVIPAQTSVAITALENTEAYLYTVLKEKLVWKK